MKVIWQAMILAGLACGWARAADGPREAARPQLIVAPHGDAAELRIVEVGGGDSQALRLGAAKALFPSSRDKGRQLVFESWASGHWQIYAMDASGGEWQNLSNNGANDHQPACSPDGAKVLFTSDRGGDFDIYVMDRDGRNPVNLTHDPGFDSDAAWSPDGKRIAFASDRSRAGFHLMVMNADGSEPRNVLDLNLGGMLYPCWSPDGQQIAFAGFAQPDVWRLYVANADGEGLQELTDGTGMSCYPCWSPDGRYLAYVHFARHPNQTPEGGRLMLMDIEEGTTREFGAGAPRVTASRMAWRPAEE